MAESLSQVFNSERKACNFAASAASNLEKGIAVFKKEFDLDNAPVNFVTNPKSVYFQSSDFRLGRPASEKYLPARPADGLSHSGCSLCALFCKFWNSSKTVISLNI